VAKLYVISYWTPEQSSGYDWYPQGFTRLDVQTHAAMESAYWGIVRLVRVKVPWRIMRKGPGAIQDYMDDIDAEDAFDYLPALWEHGTENAPPDSALARARIV